ncbi:MAG: hypothetical protein ACXABY_27260 [Candidatus Thorarchaeota archaeon]|jgi:hypothetical protein
MMLRKGWKYFTCLLGSQLMYPALAIKSEQGLFSFNGADSFSPVLVTTDYYMTVYRVTEAVERQGLKCHLLVVDGRGINVWCGSRGGSVDTDSVLDAISTSNLGDLVSHRHLILPQLAASSVSKAVLADNGWIAVFGPVEIDDVGEFIKNENRKSPEQSIATFGLHRRMEYNLAHLVFETTMFMIMTPVFLALSLLGGVMLSWHIYWMTNLFLIIVGAWILGTFMALVDPIMPTSSGYVRGAITGVFALIIWKMALLYLSPFSPLAVIYEWAWLDASGLTILGLALFVGFNWGGATPQLGEDQMIRDIVAGLGTIVVLFAIGFYFPLGIF